MWRNLDFWHFNEICGEPSYKFLSILLEILYYFYVRFWKNLWKIVGKICNYRYRYWRKVSMRFPSLVRGLDYTVDALSLQCGTQTAFRQEQPYAVQHWLDEESTEEILVVSAVCDQEIFSVPSRNTPYLSIFLEGRNVDRPSLGDRSGRPTTLSPLTFADEHFSFWIHHGNAMPLTHVLF